VARQQLPALLERARLGETTIIMKRGKPCAAIVPAEVAYGPRGALSLTKLRGTGKGLWGNVRRHVAGLRDEWS
jgi:antitoxin (DNA-binding transcriptional repressor) of toxin-antitoxin stability system